MAFRPVNYEEGRLVGLPAAATITFVKGNAAIDNGSGFMTNGASNTAVDVLYICDQTITTGSTAGEVVRFYKVDPSVLINADCDAVVSQTDVSKSCDLAAAGSLNPDAVTNALFYIESADTSNAQAVETTTRVNGFFLNGPSN